MNICLIIMWIWLFSGFTASLFYLIAWPPEERNFIQETILFILITFMGIFGLYTMFRGILILSKEKENEADNN